MKMFCKNNTKLNNNNNCDCDKTRCRLCDLMMADQKISNNNNRHVCSHFVNDSSVSQLMLQPSFNEFNIGNSVSHQFTNALQEQTIQAASAYFLPHLREMMLAACLIKGKLEIIIM